jgi:hypothetical protein
MSEPGAHRYLMHRISNETCISTSSRLRRAGARRRHSGRPDQNFTRYRAGPSDAADIIDIRRDDLLLHLLKALFAEAHGAQYLSPSPAPPPIAA